MKPIFFLLYIKQHRIYNSSDSTKFDSIWFGFEIMSLEIVPVGKNVEAQYVDMMVPLYSWGCERKVKKALANLRGIYSVNVNFLEQKVSVWGICDKNEVLSRVQRKRKEARFWDPQGNCIIQLKESHSAPQSPRPTSSFPKTRYLEIMYKVSYLNWRLVIPKGNWKGLKKAFARSNSF
ncbi:heavy metal-associated isoprenylated plant protein 21 [Primulina huaijiensis]|uniref:heavy metal-associated isoprenylated plant protein 21 n=1 Tax=Primulina huaijiensis TaxID=1492673 RepID=UPI003CC783BA